MGLHKLKKIVFLTGTRADFGKIKSLIQVLHDDVEFEVHLFVTGMHLQKKYGYTVREIIKSGFKNIHEFENETATTTMDLTLAKTIEGFSKYINLLHPDMIIIHGDRVEALAGATVGSLNNILVTHIEGGEKSGTIDELIRHAVSKLSHLHLVSNQDAKKRLIQMGELSSNIHVIGSPDIDVMFSPDLPSLAEATSNYDIDYNSYCLGMFHPVTTEVNEMSRYASHYVNAILACKDLNFILIYPNNDMGNEFIFKEFKRLEGCSNVRIFPSLRFEYFLSLLKNAQLMIGNSSAGIREAPYYGIPTINIGTRQSNRWTSDSVIHSTYDKNDIIAAIHTALEQEFEPDNSFGNGNSSSMFIELLKKPEVWDISHQKQFEDI